MLLSLSLSGSRTGAVAAAPALTRAAVRFYHENIVEHYENPR
jgi:hypothetical protein